MKKPHDRQIKVWIDEELDQQLRERAEALHMPISVLMRQFMVECLSYSHVNDSQLQLRLEGAQRGR